MGTHREKRGKLQKQGGRKGDEFGFGSGSGSILFGGSGSGSGSARVPYEKKELAQ